MYWKTREILRSRGSDQLETDVWKPSDADFCVLMINTPASDSSDGAAVFDHSRSSLNGCCTCPVTI